MQRSIHPWIGFVALLASAGCAVDANGDGPGESSDEIAAVSVAPATCRGADSVERPAGEGVEYENPILPMFARPPGVSWSDGPRAPTEGCPDPMGLRVGSEYYLYCTSYTWAGQRYNGFPIFRSSDLSHWTHVGALFPSTGPSRSDWPAWGARDSQGHPFGLFWAPDVHRLPNGTFVAYYAMPCEGSSQDQCIGVSHADAPTGPWHHRATALVTPDNNIAHPNHTWGAYDPSLLVDDADPSHVHLYLYWTVAGHAVWMRELRADGFGFEAAGPQQVGFVAPASGDTAWEQSSLEGEYVIRHGAFYYMFYSTGSLEYGYQVGVQRAESPFGPFVRRGPPILHATRNEHFAGTGGNSIMDDGRGHDFIVYHAVVRPSDAEIAATRWRDVPAASSDPGQHPRIECIRPDGTSVTMRRDERDQNPYCRVQGERQAMIDPIVWEPDPCTPGAFWPRVPNDAPSRGHQRMP